MINSNGVFVQRVWSRFGQKTPLLQAKNYNPNTTKPKGLGEPSGGRYSAAPPRSEAVAEALAAAVLPEGPRRGLGFGSDELTPQQPQTPNPCVEPRVAP